MTPESAQLAVPWSCSSHRGSLKAADFFGGSCFFFLVILLVVFVVCLVFVVICFDDFWLLGPVCLGILRAQRGLCFVACCLDLIWFNRLTLSCLKVANPKNIPKLEPLGKVTGGWSLVRTYRNEQKRKRLICLAEPWNQYQT